MPVLTIFDRWLHNHSGTGALDWGAIPLISKVSHIPVEMLESWILSPERVGPIPFVIADQLLCACDLSDAWRGPLVDYYYAVDMNWGVCARPKCIKSFRDDRTFCSPKCENAHLLEQAREMVAPDTYVVGGEECRNGHTRTEANTRHSSDGSVRCRVCESAANYRNYRKRKEAKKMAVAA